MNRLSGWIGVVLCLFLLGPGCASRRTVTDAENQGRIVEAQALIERAAASVTAMRADSAAFDQSLDQAVAVLVFPRYFRAGYFLSASGARGVLLARDQAGFWSAPAFYSLGRVGGGIQIGVEYGALVYVILDASLLESMAQDRWQLDAQASVVAITTDERNQVSGLTDQDQALLFTDMAGLYAGVSLEGAYVDFLDQITGAYHKDSSLTPTDIVLGGRGRRDGVEALVEVLLAPPGS